MGIFDFLKNLKNDVFYSKSSYYNLDKNTLFECVDKNDLNKFNYAIKHIHDLNLNTTCNNIDITMYAVLNHRTEMIKSILLSDIDVNKLTVSSFNKFGVFPLAQAVAMGYEDIVDLFLESNKCDINRTNKNGANICTYAYTSLNQAGNNMYDVAECVSKIIKDSRFLNYTSLPGNIDFLLQTAIQNDLVNIIESLNCRIDLLCKDSLLIDLLLDIYQEDFKNSNEETKDCVNALVANLCKKDIIFYKEIAESIKKFDFSKITREEAYHLYRVKENNKDRYLYLLVSYKLGCKINNIAINSNDLMYYYCLKKMQIKSSQREYLSSCNEIKDFLIEIYGFENQNENIALIFKYINKIIRFLN